MFDNNATLAAVYKVWYRFSFSTDKNQNAWTCEDRKSKSKIRVVMTYTEECIKKSTAMQQYKKHLSLKEPALGTPAYTDWITTNNEAATSLQSAVFHVLGNADGKVKGTTSAGVSTIWDRITRLKNREESKQAQSLSAAFAKTPNSVPQQEFSDSDDRL